MAKTNRRLTIFHSQDQCIKESKYLRYNSTIEPRLIIIIKIYLNQLINRSKEKIKRGKKKDFLVLVIQYIWLI